MHTYTRELSFKQLFSFCAAAGCRSQKCRSCVARNCGNHVHLDGAVSVAGPGTQRARNGVPVLPNLQPQKTSSEYYKEVEIFVHKSSSSFTNGFHTPFIACTPHAVGKSPLPNVDRVDWLHWQQSLLCAFWQAKESNFVGNRHLSCYY